ncbi:MAG: TIGR01906 family membrane protein [Chloroflexi bacterium]|nr:TIGR01906 family membrane protein [Chloroflexota bacterium]
MAILRGALVTLFILALPVWLITSNVRVAAGRAVLYEYEFQKNNTAFTSGIEKADLARVARGFGEYFSSAEEEMNLEVTAGGVRRRLFNDREVAHLKDVKGIVQLVYRVQAMALAYLLGYFAVSYALKSYSKLPGVGVLLLLSSAATIASLGAAGVAVLLGFDALFLQFHLLSFSNNLWQLDPRTDYLIRIVPREFFFDASLFIAAATILEAAVVGAGAYLWRSLARKRAGAIDNA